MIVGIWLVPVGVGGKMLGYMDEIKSCLRVITNPKDARPGEFRENLDRLDGLLEAHRASLHPRLRHFLENRSYQKAWIWLEGGAPEKGSCGG